MPYKWDSFPLQVYCSPSCFEQMFNSVFCSSRFCLYLSAFGEMKRPSQPFGSSPFMTSATDWPFILKLWSQEPHQLRSTIPLFPPSHNHSRLIFAQIVLQGCCTSAPEGSLRMTHEKSIPKGDAKKGKDLTLMVSWRVSQSHPYEWGPNLYLPLKFPPAYFRKADDPWTTAFHLPCWIHQFKQ